jgi:hypothetical protein
MGLRLRKVRLETRIGRGFAPHLFAIQKRRSPHWAGFGRSYKTIDWGRILGMFCPMSSFGLRIAHHATGTEPLIEQIEPAVFDLLQIGLYTRIVGAEGVADDVEPFRSRLDR